MQQCPVYFTFTYCSGDADITRRHERAAAAAAAAAVAGRWSRGRTGTM